MGQSAEAREKLDRYIALKRALDAALDEAEALGMDNVAAEVAAARDALVGNTVQLGPIEFTSGATDHDRGGRARPS